LSQLDIFFCGEGHYGFCGEGHYGNCLFLGFIILI